jgi:hypothetical protein
MDKLKEILGLLRRQHFWFIAPLLLVIGLVGWIMANRQLTEQFESGRTKVQTYISQMQSVSSQERHPNPAYHRGMEQLIKQRRENVRAAWERKWERQRQELKWPEGLPTEFVKLVDQMRPIEKEDASLRQPSTPMRQMYATFIGKTLPELATRIGAKWEPSTRGQPSRLATADRFRQTPPGPQRGGQADSGGAGEQPALVRWNPQNQGEIAARFDWGAKLPSTLEILYAQEDLWVLTTLVDIIQRTNGEAMIRSHAAIKEIDFIQIGKDVFPPSQQGFHVVRPEPLMDGDPASDDPDSTASDQPAVLDMDDSKSGEPTADGLEGPPDPKLELVKNRYYDLNYEPIADLQSSSMKVAKRIPVRLRLRMDQRKINELLVQCANAPLTFEVRQLRFNPQGDPTGGQVNRRQELLPSSGGTVKSLDDYESLDRTIELFGIVYIFNPVDDVVLDGEMGSDSVPVDDDTAARLPADRLLPERMARSR